jgi:hypothetical protein
MCELSKFYEFEKRNNMTDLEIQQYIEENCRYQDGEPMMDEQTFYEGAKWYRDYVVNKLPMPVVSNNEVAVCDHNWKARRMGARLPTRKCTKCGEVR